jgi:hypothetical protein
MKAIAMILAAVLLVAGAPALAQPMADGHTLSADELKECVQYKHDTVSQIDESLAKLHQEHLDALRMKDAKRRKAVEVEEGKLKAAHSRAVRKAPKDYWPEIVAKREAEARAAEEKAAAEKARADIARAARSSELSTPSSTAGKVWVGPYTRKNGTHVKGYWRSK